MTTNDEQRKLEGIAMNIVFQIGDALYEVLPPNVAHEHFVIARQQTNDKAIDFTKKLIEQAVLAARIDELKKIDDAQASRFGHSNFLLYKYVEDRVAALQQEAQKGSE